MPNSSSPPQNRRSLKEIFTELEKPQPAPPPAPQAAVPPPKSMPKPEVDVPQPPKSSHPPRTLRKAFLAAAAIGFVAHHFGIDKMIFGEKTDTPKSASVAKPLPSTGLWAGEQNAKSEAPPASSATVPEWFVQDIKKKAAWLPDAFKTPAAVADPYSVIEAQYKTRMDKMFYDAHKNVKDMQIPRWMVALIPSGDQDQEQEINEKLGQIGNLSGAEPQGRVAARVEQLSIFSAAAQLPTVGDNTTGASLKDAGCAATLSKYIFAPLSLEFPQFASLGKKFTSTQRNVDLKDSFAEAERLGLVTTKTVPFDSLTPEHFKAGMYIIAGKTEGNHAMIWSRVPARWGWGEDALLAVANTGLPQFGKPHMILAQEYVAGPNEPRHNPHGSMLSRQTGLDGDPQTNPYFKYKKDFYMVTFNDPDAPRPVARQRMGAAP